MRIELSPVTEDGVSIGEETTIETASFHRVGDLLDRIEILESITSLQVAGQPPGIAANRKISF